MYRTKEIRWFFKEDNETIDNWFSNLDFNPNEEREDFYLHLKKEDIGVKLREGNVEVKHRVGTRAKGCVTKQAWGHFEHWVKWSFDAENDEELSAITEGGAKRWISVYKQRKTAQLTLHNGKMAIESPEAELPFGCQLEYGSIQIMEESWYTFGLEWFGDTCVEPNASLINEVLGDTQLPMNQSMGYPAFLSRLNIPGEKISLLASQN